MTDLETEIAVREETKTELEYLKRENRENMPSMIIGNALLFSMMGPVGTIIGIVGGIHDYRKLNREIEEEYCRITKEIEELRGPEERTTTPYQTK